VKAFPFKCTYDFIDFIPRSVASITSNEGSMHVRDSGIFMADGRRRWCNPELKYVHISPLNHIVADFGYLRFLPLSRRLLSEAITAIL
jgi:hypothetical protein